MRHKLAAGFVTALLTASLVTSAATAAQAAPKRGHVKLTISGSHSLVSGETKTFQVTAPKTAKHATVNLQVGSTKGWQTITSVKVNKKGKAHSALPVSGVGAIQYRAVVGSKGTTYKGGVSKAVSLTLSKWFNLSGQNPTDGSWQTGSRTVAGIQYDNSVYHNVHSAYFDSGDYSGTVTYNLGYKCSQFSAVVGVSDDSGTLPTPVQFTTSVDGSTLSQVSLPSGQAAPVTLDTTGRFRVTLTDLYVNSAKASYGFSSVWGNAKILCTADPNPSE